MGEFDRLWGELESRYRKLTPVTSDAQQRAARVMPGGDTRQSVFFRPYPQYLDRGEGAHVYDLDGNRFLDCNNCMSALVLGHAHPAVVDAVSRQISQGTAFTAETAASIELAELLVQRVESLDEVRFTNSGTEATLFAVRAARGFTGRPKIAKMLGGYHGSHDEFLTALGRPSPGLMPTACDNVIDLFFNEKDSTDKVLEEHGQKIAAVIVEPVMGAAGVIVPEDDFLAHLRTETAKRGILLIFDEVVTLRLGVGGAQTLYGVRPDLTTMGKTIGGGFPVGAFGGRRDLMEQFSPYQTGPVFHSGTFNGNPVTMLAGAATLRCMDEAAYAHLDGIGSRFASGVRRVAADTRAPLQISGVGSIYNLHFAPEVPRTPAMAFGDRRLLALLHLRLLTDGVLTGERGYFCFSAVTTAEEIDEVVEKINAALVWMRPAIEERIEVFKQSLLDIKEKGQI